MKTFPMAAAHGSAIFSPCGRYRYELTRWCKGTGASVRPVVFIMLNPSTASEELDDPTICRCWGFTTTWGYRSMVIVNLFALRATDPKELYQAESPVGPENDRWLLQSTAGAAMIVAAWGKHGGLGRRAEAVLQLLAARPLTRLVLNKDGSPKHPLYLRKDLTPIPFHWAR
jgi:hypothetical protein